MTPLSRSRPTPSRSSGSSPDGCPALPGRLLRRRRRAARRSFLRRVGRLLAHVARRLLRLARGLPTLLLRLGGLGGRRVLRVLRLVLRSLAARLLAPGRLLRVGLLLRRGVLRVVHRRLRPGGRGEPERREDRDLPDELPHVLPPGGAPPPPLRCARAAWNTRGVSDGADGRSAPSLELRPCAAPRGRSPGARRLRAGGGRDRATPGSQGVGGGRAAR